MSPRFDKYLALSLAALSVLLWTACAERSPEERIAEIRTQYQLEPTGLLIREIEAPEAAAEAVEGAEEAAAEAVEGGEEAAAEAVEGGEEAAAEAGPRTVNVLFDLIVHFRGRESLPGITVEIAHSDPFDKEKARYRQWIETAGMAKDSQRQESFEREIPDYEDGDQFSIEFRPFIPPEERGDYQEFASVGSSG